MSATADRDATLAPDRELYAARRDYASDDATTDTRALAPGSELYNAAARQGDESDDETATDTRAEAQARADQEPRRALALEFLGVVLSRDATGDASDERAAASPLDHLPNELIDEIVEFGGPKVVCKRLWSSGLRVRHICLSCCHAKVVDYELVAIVAARPRVEKLRLHHLVHCTASGVSLMVQAVGARLVDLDVTSSFGVTDHTLKVVALTCPALRRIVFSGAGKCSDRGLRHVAGGAAAVSGCLASVEFESFNYSWDFITDRGLRALATVRSLTHVNLSGNNGVSVRGIRALAACPLVSLACRGCERCDDAWLESLASIGTLRFLDARNNHLVTPAGRAALAAVDVLLSEATDGGGDDDTEARGFEDRVFKAMGLSRDQRVFGGQYGGVGLGEDEMSLYRPDKANCYK